MEVRKPHLYPYFNHLVWGDRSLQGAEPLKGTGLLK